MKSKPGGREYHTGKGLKNEGWRRGEGRRQGRKKDKKGRKEAKGKRKEGTEI